MNYYNHLYWVGLLLFIGCKSSSTGSSAATTAQINQKITQKLGDSFTTSNNTQNTYVLAWKEDRSSGTMVLRYGVWSLSSAELVYAGSAINGKVTWLDNESLLVDDYPGIIDGDKQTYQYKIDLKTKTKIPLNEKADL